MSYPFKIQMNNSLGMANGWPMRSAEPVIEQRIFITADPVIPTYYLIENAWSPSGDFTVKFKVSLSDVVTSSEQVVLGKTTDALGFIRFVAGTLEVNLTTASGAVVFTSIKLNANELTLITISYVSATNALTATLPNGTSQTLTHVVDNVNFNVVASKASMAYLGGVIADIYLIDPVLPANSESWKLDKPYPVNTEQSSSGNNLLTYVGATEATRELFTKDEDDWLGVERVLNGTFIDGTDWVLMTGWTMSNGLTVSGAANNSSIRQGAVVVPGQSFKYSISIPTVNSGSLDINLGSSNRFGDFSTAGDYSGVELAVGAASVFMQSDQSLSFDGFVSELSVKRILQAP